jgi:predicted PhzF superfamily epimerase YddE/YHI9
VVVRARIHQVVTFAIEPFRGNPAFVLSLAQPASDTVLSAVAAELHEVVLAALGPADRDRVALRFYAPEGPHAGAGHATMAAAHVELAKRSEPGAGVTFLLADGSERAAARDGDRIGVSWPLMPGTPIDRRQELGAALGRPPSETLAAPFGYVAVYDNAADVQALDPDMAALTRLDRGAVIATAPGNPSDIVIRVFAPKLGLPEDPVCGTAHRILIPYWAERLGRRELHSRHLSPRGGDLWCRLEDTQVVIAGQSHTFLEGVLELPER